MFSKNAYNSQQNYKFSKDLILLEKKIETQLQKYSYSKKKGNSLSLIMTRVILNRKKNRIFDSKSSEIGNFLSSKNFPSLFPILFFVLTTLQVLIIARKFASILQGKIGPTWKVRKVISRVQVDRECHLAKHLISLNHLINKYFTFFQTGFLSIFRKILNCFVSFEQDLSTRESRQISTGLGIAREIGLLFCNQKYKISNVGTHLQPKFCLDDLVQSLH